MHGWERTGRAAGMRRGGAETPWTPGSAARCNKLASLQVEKAVEVVRTHEDGTSTAVGTVAPSGMASAVTREWTPAGDVDGGADMWTWKALGYEPGGKRCASDCGHAQQ